jgi:MYXO-CTERM domain-containing protein
VRWGLGVLTMVLGWPLSVGAQHYQLTARGDVLMCEPVDCGAEGDGCSYGGNASTCRELVAGALICADHEVEVYCCNTTEDCPSGTECHELEAESFGVCVGGEYPLTFCAETPYDEIDLARCRDPNYASMYDWGHGDCDGDDVNNVDDDSPCDGPARCPCDADVEKIAGEDYVVNLSDIGTLTGCIGAPPDGACADADVNCDGVVDQCDVAVVQRVVELGLHEPEHYLCNARCGACDTPEGCVQTSGSYCTETLGGTYRGDNRVCRVSEDGGARDDGALRTDTGGAGSSFRGAGGCACRAAPTDHDAERGALSFALLLFALLRLRKTA